MIFGLAIIDFTVGECWVKDVESLEEIMQPKIVRDFIDDYLDGDLTKVNLENAKHRLGDCPGGHGLEVLPSRNSNYRCDGCGNSQDEGTDMYSCRQCNYDECFACHEASQMLDD